MIVKCLRCVCTARIDNETVIGIDISNSKQGVEEMVGSLSPRFIHSIICPGLIAASRAVTPTMRVVMELVRSRRKGKVHKMSDRCLTLATTG